MFDADMQSIRTVPGMGKGLTFLEILRLKLLWEDGGGGDVGNFIVTALYTFPAIRYCIAHVQESPGSSAIQGSMNLVDFNAKRHHNISPSLSHFRNTLLYMSHRK